MSTSSSEETKKFLQVAFRAKVEAIDTDPWTTVYSSHEGTDGSHLCFCALVDKEKVAKVMSRDSCDLLIGDGLPGFSQSDDGEESLTAYHRFGGDNGIEPLVFARKFHGLKPDYIELAEEFRLLFNLYYDKHNDHYLRFNASGDEEIIAEVSPDLVRIKTRPLRQFLAVRGVQLAVFFDFVAFSTSSVEDVSSEEREVTVNQPHVRYSFHVGDHTVNGRTFSRLLGKRLIEPLPIEECGIWPYDKKPQRYVDFIIGLDKDGNEIAHTCDPKQLSNSFGKNEGSPCFLTPVVFGRDVLQKYYGHPEKYEVEDGYLRCAGLWGLPLDNDSNDRVTVFLGDLGRNLEYEEQLYWRSYNIAPFGDGKDISDTTKRRSFYAEFVGPAAPDLIFKSALKDFQVRWEKCFDWSLIRPVDEENLHVLQRLHVPITKSLSEFESQLLDLTKILVDSLNDKAIAKAIGGASLNEKSIAKFERFLTSKNYPSTKRDIALLRQLQEARSSMGAHRKGDSSKKVAEKLGLSTQTAQEVFSTWLHDATDMLNGLTEFFLDRAKE